MAKTVASLSVSINARTRGLRNGLKNAGRMVAQFQTQVNKTVGAIAKIGVGLGALGAGAAVSGTAIAIRSLDKLAKTADKLSIEPKALIALRDAAQQSGIEVGVFDTALQRMLRRIQEASKGKGEALGVLKDLGLDAQTLVRLAPEKQFLKISEAMGKAEKDGLGLARAMKLFDTEGVAMVNTIRLINEIGFKKFEDDVRRSGRAITREQLRPIESIGDRLSRIGDRFSGIFTQAAVKVSPALDKLLKRLERFLNLPSTIALINKGFKSLGDILDSITEENINKFLKKLEEIEKTIVSAWEAVIAFGRDAAKIFDTLGIKIGETFAKAALKIEKFRDEASLDVFKSVPSSAAFQKLVEQQDTSKFDPLRSSRATEEDPFSAIDTFGFIRSMDRMGDRFVTLGEVTVDAAKAVKKFGTGAVDAVKKIAKADPMFGNPARGTGTINGKTIKSLQGGFSSAFGASRPFVPQGLMGQKMGAPMFGSRFTPGGAPGTSMGGDASKKLEETNKILEDIKMKTPDVPQGTFVLIRG